MMYKWMLILHVLGACIWTGGHLVLCLRYLPKSLKAKDPSIILNFEKHYEPVGIPSLLIQVVTGLWFAFHFYKTGLFSFQNTAATVVSIKFILLLLIVLAAIHARFFIIPKLNEKNLKAMAFHILFVTLLSVLMLYLGVNFRFGTIV